MYTYKNIGISRLKGTLAGAKKHPDDDELAKRVLQLHTLCKM